jgi:hypothetical protein
MILRLQLTATALCALAFGSACTKPATDLSEAAYGRAVGQFAMLSGETKDLTYRDARFDQVLEALDQVPAGSASDRARALAQRIRLARMTAEQADQKSQQEIREATAPPLFVPGNRAAMSAPIPPKAPALAGARQPTTLAVNATLPAAAGAAAQATDWYHQAGYGQPAAAAPAAPPPEPEAEMAQSQVSGKPDASARPSSSGEAPNDGGWRIYGLPGPAGKAMGGGAP